MNGCDADEALSPVAGFCVPTTDADTRSRNIEFLRQTGWFDAAWYVARNPDGMQSGQDPLTHYVEHGAAAGIGPNQFVDGLRDTVDTLVAPCMPGGSADPAVIECEIELLRASGLFDAAFYLEGNSDALLAGIDPLRHFCEHGWKELRKPSRTFDVWWYWSMYLDPAREAINPLVHYAVVGHYAGHLGCPAPLMPEPGYFHPPGSNIRRICLFAGFDPDGTVDDYVVALVRELSRHADVYYLADCFMQPEELRKLAPYTRGRWARRHGTYDFGSYSILARDLVGWNVIDRYDELILVNDSGYLLGSMDHVFARMDAKACDWWGLQATKGIAKTRHNPANQFRERIPMVQVKDTLLGGFENDHLYDFHLGSYFLVYRRPVLRDARFRRLLDAVRAQPSKLRIIQKYEIGLTHFLIGNGYDFDTFIEYLYPFHPVYTRNHFDLIREGFPFLKRYFLSENHYDTPGLAQWKQTLFELIPDAPVDMIERNLLRVAADDKLQRSFAITEADDGSVIVPKLLDNGAFAAADRTSPKFDHWWAFPVCAFDHTFAGNERAVFEEVRLDPSIRKIVLTRSKRIGMDGENVVVVPLNSPEGQQYLLRSRQIFVKHGPRINVPFPLSPKLHNFINLWHGIPLKRFGYASLDMAQRLPWVAQENRGCRAVISSSRVDTLAMAAAFYPLSYRDIWPTGLPRNDFILRAVERLPADLRAAEQRLRAEVGERRLVLFLPTFKNAQEDGYYRFTDAELAVLGDWLQRNHAVLGVREHMADKARTYSTMLAPLGIVDLSSSRYPDIEVLYRVGSVLVTDYSSCVIDFLLTGKPVVSFAYDYDNYDGSERGLFYDLEFALPGPVCRDFGQFVHALEHVFDAPDASQRETYAWKREMFFDHCDDGNAWRVVKQVKGLYVGQEA